MKRNSEFASLRLPDDLRKKVTRMAQQERRTLSLMLRILVEEALERRGIRVIGDKQPVHLSQ